jgi:hypothetical protein
MYVIYHQEVKMTLIATVYTPNCIVMGADTLLQVTRDYLSTEIIGISSVQKLFYLSKTKTGFSVRGRASWGNKSIRNILEDFSSTIDFSYSQKEVAESFYDYFKTNYPKLECSFHIAGYTNDEPYVYDMDFINGFCRENIVNSRLKYSVLVRVDDPEVRNEVLPLPDFSTFTDKEAIEFLKKLFCLKIDVESRKSIPAVGYPVDYLILYPNGNIAMDSHRNLSDFFI